MHSHGSLILDQTFQTGQSNQIMKLLFFFFNLIYFSAINEMISIQSKMNRTDKKKKKMCHLQIYIHKYANV